MVNLYVNHSNTINPAINSYTGFTQITTAYASYDKESTLSKTYIGVATSSTVTFTYSVSIPNEYLFSAYQA